MIKNLLTGLLAFGLILIISGCGGTKIQNVPAQPITQQLSQETVRNAIYRAGLTRNWDMQKINSGLIEGTYARRGYTVTISIHYNANSYSIDYKSSQGLGYSEGSQTIHKNYNSWISRLKRQINGELVLSASSNGSSVVNTPVSEAITTETPVVQTTTSKPSNDW